LEHHAELHGIGGREARERSRAALARVDLADRARDKVGKLSGGQMRRVEIARALLHRPRLLLLDEPTVGLDVKARAGILARVRALLDEEHIGVLWATHLIDEARPGDDVVILHRGKVLAQGPIDALIARHGGKDLASVFTELTGAEAAA
jgi:ABC-2 type transport system ATP-binding protein